MPTQPVIVHLLKMADPLKGIWPELMAHPVDEKDVLYLEKPHKPTPEQLLKPHPPGPILWDIQRHQQDSYYVENNLIITNLLQCHNNASPITGHDSGQAVEEYTSAYMTKEGAPLRQAAAVLLAAVENIFLHPSKAEDTGTLQRTGKHLAARTVNGFTGSHQWSMPVMAYALRQSLLP